MTTAITTRLHEAEQRMEAAKQQFVLDVGRELQTIRDERLYRDAGYNDFDTYCRQRWEMSRIHAHRLIEAASVINNLLPIGNTLPANEAQARPLTKLDPEQQREVWQLAVETAPDGKVTAGHVEKTTQHYVDHLKPKAPPRPPPTMNRVNENIEWAAWSWNPVTGCLHNCDYCYARDIANRFYPQGFEPTYHPERLAMPANTNQIAPRWNGDTGHNNVFVCSMADLFGKWVPEEWITSVIDVAASNPQWTFLFLTKFPIRMADFDYPPNAWLGTSVDRQHAVKRAETAFRKIKASGFTGICWLSCEPMLERLNFTTLSMFDWVVMGGASKSSMTPEYRPPFDDTLHLYQQARKANCKVYMKTNLFNRVREYPGG